MKRGVCPVLYLLPENEQHKYNDNLPDQAAEKIHGRDFKRLLESMSPATFFVSLCVVGVELLDG